jgi:hypothetical protein
MASKLAMPKDGVKLACFRQFINAHGGEPAFAGLTTTDVCTKYLKADTLCGAEGKPVSYVELLRQQQSPLVSTATVFISHAWKYQFLDVSHLLGDIALILLAGLDVRQQL